MFFRCFIFVNILITLGLLLGCEAQVDTIHKERVKYCSKTSDSITKKIAIKVIQTKLPGYPEGGICVGITDSEIRGDS